MDIQSGLGYINLRKQQLEVEGDILKGIQVLEGTNTSGRHFVSLRETSSLFPHTLTPLPFPFSHVPPLIANTT